MVRFGRLAVGLERDIGERSDGPECVTGKREMILPPFPIALPRPQRPQMLPIGPLSGEGALLIKIDQLWSMTKGIKWSIWCFFPFCPVLPLKVTLRVSQLLYIFQRNHGFQLLRALPNICTSFPTMSSDASKAKSPPLSPLQRGKACLNCRYVFVSILETPDPYLRPGNEKWFEQIVL